MHIVSNTVKYMDGDVVLEGFFAVDEDIVGQRPAVLISHAWGGRDEFVAEKAKKLAELGYVGFALDMYGNGLLGKSPEENSVLMQPFMQDRAMLQTRINSALQALRLLPWVDTNKIAAMGFCFGGLCVLDLARSGADIKGVLSFHGLLQPPAEANTNIIKAKVLALHGHNDPMVPVATVQAFQEEMTCAGVDWQMQIYGNTMHAFTNPVANNPDFGTVYQASADRRSWIAMRNYFAELFA